VTAIAKGTEDVHAVRLKPSHVVAASRADCFLQVGLSLEHAWVPGLLQTARNPRIQPGSAGFVDVSQHWRAIDVPDDVSRRHGADLHPSGNPHINLAPAGGRHIAALIVAAFVRLRPESEPELRKRHEKWLADLAAAEPRWAALREHVAGRRVVTYHAEFDYFLRALGVEPVGTIEPKPGVPPTPKHLARLLSVMREKEAQLVLSATWSNQRQVDDFRKKAGARGVRLPSMVNATETADSWIALMDELHAAIARGFGVPWPPERPK
jgi:zinc/manganese transport system substrate-binding protein